MIHGVEAPEALSLQSEIRNGFAQRLWKVAAQTTLPAYRIATKTADSWASRLQNLASLPEEVQKEELKKRKSGMAAAARPVRLAFRWRPRLSDPDDDMVLETAINGSASAIVTFNQRDFATGTKGFNCAVILPATALQQIRSSNP
jgi:predicted nucleic acid-binding protein